jgi:hypothetical protein
VYLAMDCSMIFPPKPTAVSNRSPGISPTMRRNSPDGFDNGIEFADEAVVAM